MTSTTSTIVASLLCVAPLLAAAGAQSQQSAPTGAAKQGQQAQQAQQTQQPQQPQQPDGGPPLAPSTDESLPLVLVDRDDVVVSSSARIVFANKPIPDLNGDGVVKITAPADGPGIVVDLSGTTLLGSDPSTPPEARAGIGIVVTGSNVVLRNGRVKGFRAAVNVRDVDGGTFEFLDLSDNVASRLHSTTAAEDQRDWLWPHDNDERQWFERYGAALLVERSKNVVIRDVHVRRTQNGIILDRVERSRIYDNDASFLSGWGLAMWRTNDTIVARNAFDFCIRGYSHGVYSRGQDSAGILMFEQCSRNVIALNSATHGGDGLFGFAGKEALGERLPKDVDADGAAAFAAKRGCNDNIIVGNDFSHAAAHGLEMTFSFRNVIAHNRFVDNAICGIWAGYSQESIIANNEFARNGGPRDEAAGFGEGGGIDIEHGARNRIEGNTFVDEGVAVEFWWDDDTALLATPWAKANGGESRDALVIGNRFERCDVALGLRRTTGTIFSDNTLVETPIDVKADDASPLATGREPPPMASVPPPSALAAELPGLRSPIGARRSLGGREAIRMTPYGPWDGEGTVVLLEDARPDRQSWRFFGDAKIDGVDVAGGGSLRVSPTQDEHVFNVSTELPGTVAPYMLRVRHGGDATFAFGCIVHADWRVSFFPSKFDPRVDLELWRERAKSTESVVVEVPAIDFRFGSEGPASLDLKGLAGETLRGSKLPADHFGMIARATLRFPKGEFTLRTTSDDGVRVTVDGAVLIEDWTWHAPREHRATIRFEEPREVEVVIEHFELDGHAELRFFIDGELDPRRRAVFGR